MISEREISSRQQRKNRNFYKAFSVTNAFGYNCQGVNIIILFALALGAPNYIAAFLGSFIYLGFVGMPLGKMMIRQMGASGSLALNWFLRAFFGFIMAMSPFFKSYGQSIAVLVLSIGAFGFFFFRASGVCSIQPVYGEITDKNNRGRFMSTIFLQYNIIALLIFCIISFALSKSQQPWIYQIFIIAGTVFTLMGSFFASRIVESSLPKFSATQPIKEVAFKVLQSKKFRSVLFSNCVVLSALSLSSPVSLICLKKAYLISDSDALLYIIVQFTGGIVISLISRFLSEHTGPRPLLILFYFLVPLICLLWVIAPSEFSAIYCTLIFFLNGCAIMGCNLVLSHYSINAVSDKDRVGISLIFTLTSGVLAGLSGVVISGGLLKLLPYANLSDLNLFKVYFFIILALTLLASLVIFKLEKIKDWDVKQVINLFFAPRDLRTLMILNSMNSENFSEKKESDKIDKLKATHSSLSENALLKSLDSPKMEMRVKAMLALHDIEFGKKSKKCILHELEHGIYSTAAAAAIVAGDCGVTEALPILRKHLDSDDVYLKSRCLKALGQLGDKSDIERIKNIFVESDNPRMVIYGALGLAAGKDGHMLELILKKSVEEGPLVSKEVLVAAAKIIDIQDAFYRLVSRYNSSQDGLKHYIADYLESLNENNFNAAFIKDFCDEKMTNQHFSRSLHKAFSAQDGSIEQSIANFLSSTPEEKLGLLLKCLLLGAACKLNLEIGE